MVSLAQVSIYGIAGFVLGNATTNGNTKGLNLGWSPWWGIVVGLVFAVGDGAPLRRAREPERRHLLPDDHADVLGDREPLLRPGDRRLRLRRHQRHPGAERDRQRRRAHEPPLLRRARRRAPRLRAAALPRADAVRADAAGRPRRPGADGLARLQRAAPPHDRVRVRRLHRGDRRRALRLVERPHRPGVDRPRRNHRLAGDRRRRRPLPARGRLGRRPVLRRHQQLLAAHRLHRPALPHVDRRDLPRDRAGLARRPRRPLGTRRQPSLRDAPRPARPQPVGSGRPSPASERRGHTDNVPASNAWRFARFDERSRNHKAQRRAKDG